MPLTSCRANVYFLENFFSPCRACIQYTTEIRYFKIFFWTIFFLGNYKQYFKRSVNRFLETNLLLELSINPGFKLTSIEQTSPGHYSLSILDESSSLITIWYLGHHNTIWYLGHLITKHAKLIIQCDRVKYYLDTWTLFIVHVIRVTMFDFRTVIWILGHYITTYL